MGDYSWPVTTALDLRAWGQKPAPPSPAEVDRIRAACERWANEHPYHVMYHRVFDGDELARLRFWQWMYQQGRIAEK